MKDLASRRRNKCMSVEQQPQRQQKGIEKGYGLNYINRIN